MFVSSVDADEAAAGIGMTGCDDDSAKAPVSFCVRLED